MLISPSSEYEKSSVMYKDTPPPLLFLAAASSSINTPCLSVRLSVCLSVRHTLLGCDSSQIMVKLGRDVPWAKILAEFIDGRHSSLNERLTS